MIFALTSVIKYTTEQTDFGASVTRPAVCYWDIHCALIQYSVCSEPAPPVFHSLSDLLQILRIAGRWTCAIVSSFMRSASLVDGVCDVYSHMKGTIESMDYMPRVAKKATNAENNAL